MICLFLFILQLGAIGAITLGWIKLPGAANESGQNEKVRISKKISKKKSKKIKKISKKNHKNIKKIKKNQKKSKKILKLFQKKSVCPYLYSYSAPR